MGLYYAKYKKSSLALKVTDTSPRLASTFWIATTLLGCRKEYAVLVDTFPSTLAELIAQLLD